MLRVVEAHRGGREGVRGLQRVLDDEIDYYTYKQERAEAQGRPLEQVLQPGCQREVFTRTEMHQSAFQR